MVATASFAQAPRIEPCGEVVVLDTRPGNTLRLTWAPGSGTAASGPLTLVLLAGGGGHLDLDGRGCARKLAGNSLVRSIPLFNAAGFNTALVDAPSGFQGEDGLGGFRTDPRHAQDLGEVIAWLRTRTQGAVWVVGTSRGAISAANVASRLSGPAAPDGVVLTSALMAGQPGARKPWVAQSVFDLPLQDIRVPLLVVGHSADTCVRSPAGLMPQLAARTRSPRQQVVTVSGGPGGPARSGLDACEGRTPHGFVDQEAEVATGIARFVLGGTY
jgi:alpha-beta hydrolase superfamily lysophospholipase